MSSAAGLISSAAGALPAAEGPAFNHEAPTPAALVSTAAASLPNNTDNQEYHLEGKTAPGSADLRAMRDPRQAHLMPHAIPGAISPRPTLTATAVCTENPGQVFLDATKAAQRISDNTKNKPEPAGVLLSPAPTFTPGTDAAILMPKVFPTGTVAPTMDPLASPPRPKASSNTAAAFASPVPPPSAGKQEVNDAAMALTWLAEALTGPGSQSPLVPKKQITANATAPATLFRAEPIDRRRKVATVTTFALETSPPEAAPATITQGRGRRAASQRCNTVVQEAILNERLLSYNPRTLHNMEAAAARTGAKRAGPRSTDAAVAAAAERKLKGYSENSRVGRAMSSILDYITQHQPSYHGITPFGGVPERVIRQEFGNNPDTSKALRFLVTEKRIVRKGMGGRRDPFNYVLSNRGSVGPRARASSPADSAEENRVDNSNVQLVPSSLTPAPGLAESAAAAAALTAPSTGKWAPTLPRREVEYEVSKGRKPLQPRLSLGMTDAAALEQGRAVINASKEMVISQAGGVIVGQKRSAPATHTPAHHTGGLSGYTPSASRLAQPPAKRPATASSADDNAIAGFMATVIAGAAQEEAVQKTGTTAMLSSAATSAAGAATNTNTTAAAVVVAPTPVSVPASSFITPAPKTRVLPKEKPADWMAWPSQLPSTQRLTTQASPPPLNATPAGGPVFLLPGASAALLGTTPQQQAAAQAYLLQLQAAQLLWKHQIAQRAGQEANAGAAAMSTRVQGAAANTPAPAATAPVTAALPTAAVAVSKTAVAPQQA